MDIKHPILEGLDNAFDQFFNPRSIVERVKNGEGVLWYNPKTHFFYKTMVKAHVGSLKEHISNSGIDIYPQNLDRTVWIRRGRKWFKHKANETFRLRALEKEYK
jgi:hypothetical protein